MMINYWPEVACLLAKVVAVDEEIFENSSIQCIKSLTYIVEYVRIYNNTTLKYTKIDKNSFAVVVYSDVLHETNEYQTSNLGYFIILAQREWLSN